MWHHPVGAESYKLTLSFHFNTASSRTAVGGDGAMSPRRLTRGPTTPPGVTLGGWRRRPTGGPDTAPGVTLGGWRRRPTRGPANPPGVTLGGWRRRPTRGPANPPGDQPTRPVWRWEGDVVDRPGDQPTRSVWRSEGDVVDRPGDQPTRPVWRWEGDVVDRTARRPHQPVHRSTTDTTARKTRTTYTRQRRYVVITHPTPYTHPSPRSYLHTTTNHRPRQFSRVFDGIPGRLTGRPPLTTAFVRWPQVSCTSGRAVDFGLHKVSTPIGRRLNCLWVLAVGLAGRLTITI